jgi:Xaa-Pro aminopeptidase
MPDSIAWLLNIRSRDIAHTPVALAYALVRADRSASLFIDAARLDEDALAGLPDGVSLAPPAGFAASLATLAGDKAAILIDQASAPEVVRATILAAGGSIVAAADPCLLPKARKNAPEQEGARAAHRRGSTARRPPGNLTRSPSPRALRRSGPRPASCAIFPSTPSPAPAPTPPFPIIASPPAPT